MSRKVWIALIVVAVLTVLAGAVGVAGLLYYPTYKAQKYYREGNAAFEAGEWRKAKPYLAWYIHKYPEEIEPLERYAEASLNILSPRGVALGDAARAYLQLAREHPENEAYVERALRFCREKELWANLTTAAESLLLDHPDDPVLLYHRALGQEREGLLSKAAATYESIPDWSAVPVSVHGDYAALQVRQGQTEIDTTRLDEALAAEPERPDLLCQRARVLAIEGDAGAGREVLRQAGAPETLDRVSLLAAMDVCLQAKDWEGAESYARRLREMEPDDYRACQVLNAALAGQGRDEEALAVLRDTTPEMRADHPFLYMQLCDALIVGGELDEGEAVLKDFRDKWPGLGFEGQQNYFGCRIDLVRAEAAGDEKAQQAVAAEVASKMAVVVQSSPGFAGAQYLHVMALMQTGREGDETKARIALETFIRNNPDDRQARSLQQAYFGGGGGARGAAQFAGEVLGDANASAAMLAQAAQGLLASSGEGGPSPAQAADIEELLNRALAQDPASGAAHMLYVDLKLRQKDVAGARALLEGARAAGVEAATVARGEVAVLLAEGDHEAALDRYAASLGEATTAEDVEGWCGLFALRAGIDMGRAALDRAAAARPDLVDAAARRAFTTRMHLVAGEVQEAAALLEGPAPEGVSAERSWEATEAVRLDVVRELLRQGDGAMVAQGRALLAPFAERAPDNLDAKVLEAQSLLQGGDPDLDRVEALVTAVLAERGRDVNANLLMAEVSRLGGRSADAVAYARVAAEESDVAEAQLTYAQALLNTQEAGNAETARQTLLAVLVGNPDNPGALVLLADLSLRQGLVNQAADYLGRLDALPEGSFDPTALENLRTAIELQQGDSGEAMARLRQRFETAPEDIATAQRLSRELERREDPAGAEAVLKKHTEANGDGAASWTLLGEFYLGRGDDTLLSKASSAFTRALLLQNDYAPAVLGRINVELRSNRPGNALGLCDRYLALRPDDVQVRFSKATLLASTEGRAAEAMGILDALIAERGSAPNYLTVRGLVRLGAEDFQGALDDLRQIRSIEGSTTALVDAAMARAYVGLDDEGNARALRDLARDKFEDTGADAARVRGLLNELDTLLSDEEEE